MEGREEESERNINVWLPHTLHSLPGTWPTAQACALTGNRTWDHLVHRPALSALSHTSPGLCSCFIVYPLMFFFCFRIPYCIQLSCLLVCSDLWQFFSPSWSFMTLALLVCRLALNPLSHTSQGWLWHFWGESARYFLEYPLIWVCLMTSQDSTGVFYFWEIYRDDVLLHSASHWGYVTRLITGDGILDPLVKLVSASINRILNVKLPLYSWDKLKFVLLYFHIFQVGIFNRLFASMFMWVLSTIF